MKKSSIFVIMFFMVLSLVIGTSITQAAENLTGTWNCAVDSPAGKVKTILVLQQDGEKVTGTHMGAYGQSQITGKIQGSDFELTYKSRGSDVTYKGKVEGDKISGSLDAGTVGKGSQGGKGSFTGERKK